MLSHGAVIQRHSVEAAHFLSHTHPQKSNMPRLPHYCLIAVCLAGPLLLLPHCCAGQDDTVYDYDTTQIPEYDYNATFDFTFFSNGSTEELEKLLHGNKIADEDTVTDINDTDPEPTGPTTSGKNQASRTVYPSLLLTVVLTTHQMYRFL